MLKTKAERVLTLTVAFLVGCVSAPFVVPPVHAGTNPQSWEYVCKTFHNERQATEGANKLGAAGWEIGAGATDGENGLFCFKRPLGASVTQSVENSN